MRTCLTMPSLRRTTSRTPPIKPWVLPGFAGAQAPLPTGHGDGRTGGHGGTRPSPIVRDRQTLCRTAVDEVAPPEGFRFPVSDAIGTRCAPICLRGSRAFPRIWRTRSRCLRRSMCACTIFCPRHRRLHAHALHVRTGRNWRDCPTPQFDNIYDSQSFCTHDKFMLWGRTDALCSPCTSSTPTRRPLSSSGTAVRESRPS